MRCPNSCGQRVEFELMEQHMQQVCPKQIIPCTLGNYGCQWKGPREQLPMHLQSDCTYASIVQACMGQVQDQIMQLDNLCTTLKKACEQKDLFIQQLLSQQQQLNQQIQSLQMELDRATTANAGATSASTFVSLFGNESLSPLTPLLTPSNASPQLTKSMITMETFMGADHNNNHSNNVMSNSAKTISPPRSGNSSRDGSPTATSQIVEGTGFNIKPAYATIVGTGSAASSDSSAQSSPRNNGKNLSTSNVSNNNNNNNNANNSNNNNNTQAQIQAPIGTPNMVSTSTASQAMLSSNGLQNYNSSNSKLFLLAGGGVGSIKIWDTDTAIKNSVAGQHTYLEEDTCVHSLKGHTRFVSALHAHDGYICSGSGDTSIRLWDFESGECEAILHGCEGKVGALCTHGKYLVSGSKDGPTNHKIRLWDLSKQNCVKILSGHTDWINVLCSANDQYLFSGSGDRSVRMWDVEKGKCLLKYENTSFVLSLYYHAEQGLLYCGTYDGVIRVWDMRAPVSQQSSNNGGNTGLAKSIKAHQSGVLSLCYSNNVLVSGSKDQTIKLWDFRSSPSVRGGVWSCMATLYGHINAVKCLVPYAPNLVASGSYDRTVKLWNINDALSKSQSNGKASLAADPTSGSYEYSAVSENGGAAAAGNDTSFMTINTGFKVYSLCTYADAQDQQ